MAEKSLERQYMNIFTLFPERMEGRVVEDIQPPAEFPFPFPPYDIQTDFMRELFTTLNQGYHC